MIVVARCGYQPRFSLRGALLVDWHSSRLLPRYGPALAAVFRFLQTLLTLVVRIASPLMLLVKAVVTSSLLALV